MIRNSRSSRPGPAGATRLAAVPGRASAEGEQPCLAPQLTQREVHVLAALCEPMPPFPDAGEAATVRQIAAGLTVAEATVRQHLRHLYRKLDVPPGPDRRARLARKTTALGLLLADAPARRPSTHAGRVHDTIHDTASEDHPVTAVEFAGAQA